ncbi:MAG: hypothetical protein IID13_10690 [Candidatus Marinimicrobia bacterium]|nr:hypothetical protein [Candidatus Neomarinimicrobiota bacterium]
MKWWIPAVLVVFGLAAWCYLNLTPKAAQRRGMFNRELRADLDKRQLALPFRERHPEAPRVMPETPQSANGYLDVVE